MTTGQMLGWETVSLNTRCRLPGDVRLARPGSGWGKERRTDGQEETDCAFPPPSKTGCRGQSQSTDREALCPPRSFACLPRSGSKPGKCRGRSAVRTRWERGAQTARCRGVCGEEVDAGLGGWADRWKHFMASLDCNWAYYHNYSFKAEQFVQGMHQQNCQGSALWNYGPLSTVTVCLRSCGAVYRCVRARFFCIPPFSSSYWLLS